MKDQNDIKLQRILEKELSTDADLSQKEQEDLRIYQLLYNELGKELPVNLSPDFSSNLISKLEQKKTRRFDFSYFLLLGLFTLIGFAAIYLCTTIISNKIVTQLMEVSYMYKWLLVFVIAFCILFQLLDEKLINKRRFHPEI